jgi:hypothetical protein
MIGIVAGGGRTDKPIFDLEVREFQSTPTTPPGSQAVFLSSRQY